MRIAIILLSALTIILACKLISMRFSLSELTRELDEKLTNETNTLISLSAGDKKMRRFASEINSQLCLLRDERRKFSNGDKKIKEAVINISHDLRTPLTAIKGYLELLEGLPMPNDAERYLKIIKERTDYMQNLTQELFKYSVIMAENEELTPEKVCLNKILENSLTNFYGTFVQKGIEPEIKIPQKEVFAVLDEASIARIFENILNNAAKYSDGDLFVELDTDQKVTFKNKANKLDPVKTQKLFERFYTINNAENSTGLGLSISKELTEKNGGTINAEYIDGTLILTIQF